MISCADICDAKGDTVQYADSMPFRHYSKKTQFGGPIRTVKCFEDNSRVKEVLATPGQGSVLVVDAGASCRRAVLGDLIASSAQTNGWSGVIINGAIRDSAIIAGMDRVGVAALGTNPRKSQRRGLGTIDERVCFNGLTFIPGHYVYVDLDGVIVSTEEI